MLATTAEAHAEWHRNADVPIGYPPCPWDACHPDEDDPGPEPRPAPAAPTRDTIKLEAHICAARRSYLVTFTGPDAEQLALDFIEARNSTHAISELAAEPFDYETFPRLADALNPVCEHGMSAAWCSGPSHYGEPGDITWA